MSAYDALRDFPAPPGGGVLPTSRMTVLTPASEDTRIYEVAVVYPYPMNQKEEQDLLKAIDGFFAEAGATVVQKDVWGRRGIAYMIGGFNEANFIFYYVDMLPEKLKELDQQLKILKGVLRHMIVKPPKHYQYVSYANAPQEWKERQRVEEEVAAREREERLKKQVVEKAKRQTKKPAPKRDDSEKPTKPVKTESLDMQLDKLISDDDLNL